MPQPVCDTINRTSMRKSVLTNVEGKLTIHNKLFTETAGRRVTGPCDAQTQTNSESEN